MGFRLSEDEAWARIAAAHTGILSTLKRDGTPVALPVWHAVGDHRIYVRTPRVTKKVTRIRHDDRGSFLVESGAAWVDLCAVVVPVRARLVDDEREAVNGAALIDAKYADFVAPDELLPPAVRAAYSDIAVIALEPNGKILSWNNAALVGH